MTDTTHEHTTSTVTIISAKEAAAMLGIHITTLYEGARNGEIPCRRIGRRFVFVHETLIAWLRDPTPIQPID